MMNIPSTISTPELELKPSPKHLKYTFFAQPNALPVIIYTSLTSLPEEKVLRVLRVHQVSIRCPIVDIRGIIPNVCMHKILLEEGRKPTVEQQRHLNPIMKEVVKKEILKLLDAGII